jgi:hypothetical protein
MSATSVCYKCHWLVLDPGGFFKRKNQKDTKFPCDKCLGKMTTFQIADEARIWLRLIPRKDKQKPQPQKPEDRKAPDKVQACLPLPGSIGIE